MTFTSDEHAFAFQAAADAEAVAAFEAQQSEQAQDEVMLEDFFVSSAGQ